MFNYRLLITEEDYNNTVKKKSKLNYHLIR